jgi:hypothetical protein
MSLAYNDYFGGFSKHREIFIQTVISLGKGFQKPEEAAHNILFNFDSIVSPEMKLNLKNSALRIEKKGHFFRFLYSGGEMENSAFREIVKQDFEMEPRYIGIFALKGFVRDSSIAPAYFNLFSLTGYPCE